MVRHHRWVFGFNCRILVQLLTLSVVIFICIARHLENENPYTACFRHLNVDNMPGPGAIWSHVDLPPDGKKLLQEFNGRTTNRIVGASISEFTRARKLWSAVCVLTRTEEWIVILTYTNGCLWELVYLSIHESCKYFRTVESILNSFVCTPRHDLGFVGRSPILRSCEREVFLPRGRILNLKSSTDSRLVASEKRDQRQNLQFTAGQIEYKCNDPTLGYLT